MSRVRRRTRACAVALAACAVCCQGSPRPRVRGDGASSSPENTIVLGGDCSFARGVAARADEEGLASLFGESAEILANASLAIVNLESPLAPCLPGGSTNRPRLCGDAAQVAALERAGIDAVTLANNHALDAGEAGLLATADLLRAHEIVPLGVEAARTGEPTAEPVGEIVAVAANLTPPAYAPGASVPIPSPARLAAAVRDARKRYPARPVLVLLHLGREMDLGSQPRDEIYVRAVVRAGAAAVVMHGAHVVRAQGEEGGVPVHLGLGNLLFDQRDPRARRGLLLELRLRGDGSIEVAGTTCVDPTVSSVIDCTTALNP